MLVANSSGVLIRSCGEHETVTCARHGGGIAALTGGQPLTDKSGMAPEAIQATDIGHADRVVVTKDYFMIIGGDGDRQAVRDRIRQMRARLREATDPEERTMLRELLAQLSGGVGELRIGALRRRIARPSPRSPSRP